MKRQTINTKIILAGAFFSALVFPFLAGAATTSSGNQTASITIGSAVELVSPAGNVSFGTTTGPMIGASSDRNVDAASQAITGGHKSNNSWTITTQEITASGLNSKLSVNSSAANCSGGSFGEVNATGAQSAAGSKNAAGASANNLQAAVTACFRQPVSWADDPGAKTTTIRHVFGNGA